jgi:hypothetical protein
LFLVKKVKLDFKKKDKTKTTRMVDVKCAFFIGDYIFCVESMEDEDSVLCKYSLVVKTSDLTVEVARIVFFEYPTIAFVSPKIFPCPGGMFVDLSWHQRDSLFFCVVSGQLKKKRIPYKASQMFVDVSSDRFATWFENSSVVIYDMDESREAKEICSENFEFLLNDQPVSSVVQVRSNDVYHLRRDGASPISFSLFRCRPSETIFKRVLRIQGFDFGEDISIKMPLKFMSEDIMVCRIGHRFCKIDIKDPRKISFKLVEITEWHFSSYPEIYTERFVLTGTGRRDIFDVFTGKLTNSGDIVRPSTNLGFDVIGYSMHRHVYVAYIPASNEYLLLREKNGEYLSIWYKPYSVVLTLLQLRFVFSFCKIELAKPVFLNGTCRQTIKRKAELKMRSTAWLSHEIENIQVSLSS